MYKHICMKEGKHHCHSVHSPAQSHAWPESKINNATGLPATLQNTATSGFNNRKCY